MVKSDSIRSMLSEGKGRISVGRAEEVAALLLAQPKEATRLMQCLWDENPAVSNRAAHALERFTREELPKPIAILNQWKTPLLGLMAETVEHKMRWHLALIVPRMTLNPAECRRAAEVLQSWLGNGLGNGPEGGTAERSSIVKTMAMQGLVDLTRQDQTLLPNVLDLLRILTRTGTPAMRARGRMLLKPLEGIGERPSPDRNPRRFRRTAGTLGGQGEA